MAETSAQASPSLLKKIVDWIDAHALFYLALFLIAFIPLNPKIPLWSPIEQYIVRVRMEDLFIFGSALLVGVQVLRRKVRWLTPMFWVMSAYALIGLISSLVAIFVIQTVPLHQLHVEKTFLHFFRYLEYFSLFYIVLGSLKTRKQALFATATMALTVFAIIVYGYGQKYFYWPVYSTMNREFSKGVQLYLTEHARVQSTFGGHYDMAAYLVVLLPIILALAYQVKRRWVSTALHWTFWGGMWLLILSASRTAFVAGLAGVAGVLFFSALLKSSWKEKMGFFVSRSFVVGLCLLLLSYYFGADLIERLNFALNAQPQLKTMLDSANDQRKHYISDEALASLPLTADQLQKILPKGKPPAQGVSTDDIAAAIAAAEPMEPVASKSDEPPTPVKPLSTPLPTPNLPAIDLPAGVYEDIPDLVTVATKSADGTVTYVTKQRPRVYSKCALEKELSLCIRQEVLWPRAIEGFLTNPLTGTGYATLTKESVDQFTEADSTDNNFLRTLGETGALGFITFYGCVALVIWVAARNMNSKDWLVRGVSVGVLCGSVGLLVNAVYIDVFAASKVAQTYWGIAGLLFGLAYLDRQQKASTLPMRVEPAPLMVTKPAKPLASGLSKKTSRQRS